MKIIKVTDAVEGGLKAYEILAEKMDDGIKTLGLATGSTPIEFYKHLTASDLDFTDMTSINLDEYVGLPKDNDQSYDYFMKEHLFDKKPFKKNYLPDGLAADLDAEADHYNQIIDQNPIDLQILGIGSNGHIGFNEPGASFEGTTSLVDLTDQTIADNARFFVHENEVPRQALSMGIASIMQSKAIILMAYGKNKANAVTAMVHGPLTENLPASILQSHPEVYVIVDEGAASKL
ncbi:glucosamine-6-phosphate deaminase [Streptococcaceae bacterium ESL0687]|nr:glucosamine-6-phosphate deaminase [Streptococcaceae bacterium ESL0687]